MDNRPIGVMDSGLGGLTCVRALRSLLPCEDIVYFGDVARAPYGNRAPGTLERFARQSAAILLERDVKFIAVACGTTSTVAPHVARELPVPALGVLEASVDAALEATKTGRVGVIATTATIRSGAYQRALLARRPDAHIAARDCPLFVPLVENGFVDPDDPLTRLAVERYLAPLLPEALDTLILGCTHYPILAESIRRAMGEGVALIDSGAAAAEAAARELAARDMLADKGRPGRLDCLVSAYTQGFRGVTGILLGEEIGEEACAVVSPEDYDGV